MGADFMNVKATLFYTFFAKVAIAAVDTTKNPDDDLISKIVPIIGNGLRLVENTHFFREGSTYFFSKGFAIRIVK